MRDIDKALRGYESLDKFNSITVTQDIEFIGERTGALLSVKKRERKFFSKDYKTYGDLRNDIKRWYGAPYCPMGSREVEIEKTRIATGT